MAGFEGQPNSDIAVLPRLALLPSLDLQRLANELLGLQEVSKFSFKVTQNMQDLEGYSENVSRCSKGCSSFQKLLHCPIIRHFHFPLYAGLRRCHFWSPILGLFPQFQNSLGHDKLPSVQTISTILLFVGGQSPLLGISKDPRWPWGEHMCIHLAYPWHGPALFLTVNLCSTYVQY